MLIDAQELPDDIQIEADICIVGAGAAGIAIAHELARTPLKICLLESGGLTYDVDTQSLYKGRNTGLSYWPLHICRLRFLGGTTNHWGGVCLPLDEDDFEQRDWVRNSGWPFGKAQLQPYYKKAQSICQLGKFSYDPEDWETMETHRLPFLGDQVVTGILQRAPTRFGIIYREDLEKTDNINVYLNANVLDIKTNEAATRILSLQVACLSGNQFSVTAKSYILALGGIENARLLLLSNKTQSMGLGNQHDLVGRYFADHYYLSNLGYIVVSNPNLSFQLYQKRFNELNNVDISAFLTLSAKTRRHEKLLNTRIHIEPATWSQVSRGVRALDKMWQELRQGELPDNLISRVWSILKDLDDLAVAGHGSITDAQLLEFGAWIEPAPNSESRVSLGTERDQFGQQRVILNWQIGDQEKESLMRTLRILGTEVGSADIGRLRHNLDEDSPWPWTGGGTPGLHHMGTTRMHIDPKQGVVDENCKVHGISNLFIAGSSVFPTFGHANPTLTIVALALRLADHVKGMQT